MGIFNRNYDNAYRGYGYNRGYDRNMGYRGTSYGWGNDRDLARTRAGYGAYDRDYAAGTVRGGYDRDYKSRWETDYGDPFGDRTSRTPMRVMRGEFEGGYDRNYNAGAWNRYDRDYNAGTWNRNANAGRYSAGVGYDPYYGTGENRGNVGYGARGYDRGYRGWGYNNNRGYDSGWF